MTDKPTCGYRGDPVCFPPNCSGACPPSGTDTRPEKEQGKRMKTQKTDNEQYYTDRLQRTHIALVKAEVELRVRIIEARIEGVPWAKIAEALGISRQLAWIRYAKLVDEAGKYHQ